MTTQKVVLLTRERYQQGHLKTLMALINEGINCFFVTGKDCQTWERIMDGLIAHQRASQHWPLVISFPETPVYQVVAEALAYRSPTNHSNSEATLANHNNEVRMIQI